MSWYTRSQLLFWNLLIMLLNFAYPFRGLIRKLYLMVQQDGIYRLGIKTSLAAAAGLISGYMLYLRIQN
jgi:hypothetical protein